MRMRMRMLRRRRRVLLTPPVAILRVLPTLVLLTLTRLRRARGKEAGRRTGPRRRMRRRSSPVGSIRASVQPLEGASGTPPSPPPPSSVAPRSSLVRRLGVPLDAARSVRASSHARAEPIRVRDVRTPDDLPPRAVAHARALGVGRRRRRGARAPRQRKVRARGRRGSNALLRRRHRRFPSAQRRDARVLDVPRREPRVDLRRERLEPSAAVRRPHPALAQARERPEVLPAARAHRLRGGPERPPRVPELRRALGDHRQAVALRRVVRAPLHLFVRNISRGSSAARGRRDEVRRRGDAVRARHRVRARVRARVRRARRAVRREAREAQRARVAEVLQRPRAQLRGVVPVRRVGDGDANLREKARRVVRVGKTVAFSPTAPRASRKGSRHRPPPQNQRVEEPHGPRENRRAPDQTRARVPVQLARASVRLHERILGRREQRVGALPPDPGRAQRHRLVLPGERVGPRRRPREQKRGTVPEKRRHRTARLEPHRGSKRRREPGLGARVRLEQKQPSVGQRAKPREALVEAELPRDANDALVARQRDRGRGGDASRAPP